MPFRVWSVRSKLVSVAGEALGSLEAGWVVFDGPRSTGSTPERFVVVGADGDEVFDDESSDGGSASHEWSTMGPGSWADESGAVPCVVVAWHGGTDFDVLRADIESAVDAIEEAVLADPKLEGVLSGAELAQVT